jgi:DNA topoisomerase-1
VQKTGSPKKASPQSNGDESSDDELSLLKKFGRRVQQQQVASTASTVKSKKVTPPPPGRKSLSTGKEKALALTRTPHSGKRLSMGSAPGSAAKKKRILLTEEDIEPVNKWWDRKSDTEIKWTTMEHHGFQFNELYKPHGIELRYDGEVVPAEDIPVSLEEVLSSWAASIGSDYEHKPVFRQNAWESIKERLPANSVIKCLDKIDVSKFKQHFDEQRLARNARSKEEKEQEKIQKNAADAKYKIALIDGLREKRGIFKAEITGLFRGRGEHPRMGLLKKELHPEDVMINVGPEACVPKADVPGHAWGPVEDPFKGVQFDPEVTWLVKFPDTITQDTKYGMLGASSTWKGQNDVYKYEKARKLKKLVMKIRRDYNRKMESQNESRIRQVGTATWMIDHLALRVGGEKDTSEEADTVGCCSLRKEHIKCVEEQGVMKVSLDFLGKDSIRYENTIEIKEEDAQVFKNLEYFCASAKREEDMIFPDVKPADLNAYLHMFMPDLTAKVFRTYNASITLEQELDRFDVALKKNGGFMSDVELVKFYNDANRQVAVLCNHQKAVSKSHDASMEKLNEKLKAVQDQLKEESTVLKKGIRKGEDVTKQKNKVEKLKAQELRMATSIKMKEDNKTVALGTSKLNYMDPRVSVVFCKKVGLDITKVFSRSHLDKFPWAMYALSTWRF